MRRVTNYTEVEAVLEKYGVQPILCEELTLEEEIQLFSNVDGMIGPHGAGLTAAVWASDAHLVEIFNDTVKAPYYVLAWVLGHNYTALSADPVIEVGAQRNQNVDVDIDKLKLVLEDIIQ
jgi:capsular polysaccharide biosynthesis protein